MGLAAFADEPIDARSACIAAIDQTADTKAAVASCRMLGAPVVFVCCEEELQWWQQGAASPSLYVRTGWGEVRAFFRAHRKELSPGRLQDAKLRGAFDASRQLSFVDVGLMPLVDRHIGSQVTDLVVRLVKRLVQELWPPPAKVSPKDGRWLLRSIFWLLAGKVLHDKQVPQFEDVELGNVQDVFHRVSKHYGSTGADESIGPKRVKALSYAAEQISQYASLAQLTTEALAHVYENAFISKETRTDLGTHSTPSYLVDYIVWQLVPWIEAIPPERRHVFEPACGHAAFLVSAMRALRTISGDMAPEARARYFRSHLHGSEKDPFAVEIARLSLTLADVPNPDGWDLHEGDMFHGTLLRDSAGQAGVLLTNPPFEKLPAAEKARAAAPSFATLHNTKAAEVLARTLPFLPAGSVFGVVVPQGFLHEKNSADIRKRLVTEFELAEICLFPDKVFRFSDAESAVLLGRRMAGPNQRGSPFRYRRVREVGVEAFKQQYAVTSDEEVAQARFRAEDGWDLRVPELPDVWQWLRGSGTMEDIASVGKGVDFIGKEHREAQELVAFSDKFFVGAVPGFTRLHAGAMIHGLPKQRWLSLADEVIRRPGTGTTTGIPQVLLNYARVSRGAWRLKAFLDRDGHAITSCFLAVRPASHEIPLELLWALCNSPLPNAYVHSYTMKRHILAGAVRKLPVPRFSPADAEGIARAVRAYLEAARVVDERPSPEGRRQCRRRLLEIDAEVLRLYDLPPRLERQVLDLFAGQRRPGVPFDFDRYFPADFEPCIPLHEFISEDSQRSTAGRLRRTRDIAAPPALLAALKTAVEDFKE